MLESNNGLTNGMTKWKRQTAFKRLMLYLLKFQGDNKSRFPYHWRRKQYFFKPIWHNFFASLHHFNPFCCCTQFVYPQSFTSFDSMLICIFADRRWHQRFQTFFYCLFRFAMRTRFESLWQTYKSWIKRSEESPDRISSGRNSGRVESPNSVKSRRRNTAWSQNSDVKVGEN